MRAFLAHLEKGRRCSITTRNQRLASIHALARFIGEHSPQHVELAAQLRMIPLKKGIKTSVGHVSLDTTSIYAETDLATKHRALATLDRGRTRRATGGWSRKPDVMAFLRSLSECRWIYPVRERYPPHRA